MTGTETTSIFTLHQNLLRGVIHKCAYLYKGFPAAGSSYMAYFHLNCMNEYHTRS